MFGLCCWTLAISAGERGLPPRHAAIAGYSVKDFGAKGDGVADDTKALQRTLDAAVTDQGPRPEQRAPRVVILPPGIYRITGTINLDTRHKNLAILGTGGPRANVGPDGGNTMIRYDGPAKGTMLECKGVLGLRLTDLRLDGNRKAGIVLRVNSIPGHGAGEFFVERLVLTNAETGMEWGADADMCAADNTFLDLVIDHMTVCGFRSMQGQQLNFVFYRPEVGYTPVAYWFTRGGASTWLHPCFGWVDTAFRFHNAGINSGAFSIRGLWVENFGYTNDKKRMVFLDATGECQVTISGLSTTCQRVWGPEGDRTTPNFKLGPSAQVSVQGCMFSGRIAELQGKGERTDEQGALATWIQFDNCRFRCAADPRKDLAADDFSGYEFRNCHVVADDVAGDEYKIHESIMIPRLVKYPKQAAGQPGYETPQATQP